MALDRQNIRYFIGEEVEDTCLLGEQMLFVVGIQPAEEIDKICRTHNLKAIYLGTSQSFDGSWWHAWHTLIEQLLDWGYWVTLDFDHCHLKQIQSHAVSQHPKFIPMISVKIEHVNQLNANATIKIDDKQWGHSNSGVWCKNLRMLQHSMTYTDWNQYKGDTQVDTPDSSSL